MPFLSDPLERPTSTTVRYLTTWVTFAIICSIVLLLSGCAGPNKQDAQYLKEFDEIMRIYPDSFFVVNDSEVIKSPLKYRNEDIDIEPDPTNPIVFGPGIELDKALVKVENLECDDDLLRDSMISLQHAFALEKKQMDKLKAVISNAILPQPGTEVSQETLNSQIDEVFSEGLEIERYFANARLLVNNFRTPSNESETTFP